MLIFVAALLGAIVGAATARRRGGTGLDLAQYSAVFAIIFAIAGLIITLAIGWSGYI